MDKEFDDKNTQNPNDSGREISLENTLDDIKSVPFHMPGHKRNPDFAYLLGAERIDVTEIDGTDNLHDANGVLKDAMDFAADAYRVRATRFLVNGSTCGILAGIRTLARRGDRVLIARNCHKSVYNAVEILGLVPEYVLPEYLDEFGFYGSINPQKVDEMLKKTGAKLVVVTSPTYEGVLSDVKKIAEVCHSHGAVLFVDEAHGAHLGLDAHFKKSARELGADLVVNSLHKTMPSLTQTALLHVCSDRVDVKRLDESLQMFETSSPSYVLMNSIDACVRYAKQNPEMLDKWAVRVSALRDELSDLKRIKLFSKAVLHGADKQKVFDVDETKLVFSTANTNLSGVEFADELTPPYDIELEMASKDYAIAMTGAGDTKDMYFVLSSAVKHIDDGAKPCAENCQNTMTAPFDFLPQKVFNPCGIDGLNTKCVKIDEAVGKTSAENIWAYPPGSPIVVKGEIIDEKTLAYLKDLRANGVSVSSSLKNFPNALRVVKE